MATAMELKLAQPQSMPDGSRGHLEIRLARSVEDVKAAQRLRFEIFHGEMGAQLDPVARALRLDIDVYDAVADHLLVEHHTAAGSAVVGTYRLLRQAAPGFAGFYSSGEFDLSRLLDHTRASDGQLLELGRSCVAPAFRTSATIQLLWRGIADYLAEHGISHMFGCASFAGIDPDAHAAALSYLSHHVLAPEHLRAVALPDARIDMDRLPIGAYDPARALRALPPLMKGYLRTGALVGDGAWIDHDFGTIDVFVVMPVAAIRARYSDRFSGLRIAA
jgi:putative hemolysin